MNARFVRIFALVPLLFTAIAGSVAAQTITLDDGGFRLLVNGQEVGTETFSIRQNGSGDAASVFAIGRVVLDTARGGQQVSAQLQASGPGLRPAAYEVQVQGANAEQIQGRVVGGRFSARIVSSAGEQMKEYLASEGAVIADEGVAHQLYFLAQRVGSEGGRVPIIVPRKGRQVTATVTVRGTESINIAGTPVAARRLVINSPLGPEQHVWIDDKGRVVRFEIPSRGYVAERIAAPK